MAASSCRVCFSIGLYLPLLPGGDACLRCTRVGFMIRTLIAAGLFALHAMGTLETDAHAVAIFVMTQHAADHYVGIHCPARVKVGEFHVNGS